MLLPAPPPPKRVRIRRPVRIHTVASIAEPVEDKWTVQITTDPNGDRVPQFRVNNKTRKIETPVIHRHTVSHVFLRAVWPDGTVTLGRGVDLEAVEARVAAHMASLPPEDLEITSVQRTAGSIRDADRAGQRAIDLTLPPTPLTLEPDSPPTWTSPDDGWEYHYEINEWDEREPISRFRDGVEQAPRMVYRDEGGRIQSIAWPEEMVVNRGEYTAPGDPIQHIDFTDQGGHTHHIARAPRRTVTMRSHTNSRTVSNAERIEEGCREVENQLERVYACMTYQNQAGRVCRWTRKWFSKVRHANGDLVAILRIMSLVVAAGCLMALVR